MYKTVFLPAGILAATIIGAGMFALPYVSSRAGILPSAAYLAFFSGIFCLAHLMYADVIVRTKENLRFAGYAGLYLGAPAEWLAVLTTIVGMIFTLTIELLLATSFFSLLAPAASHLTPFFLLWLFGSAAMFWSINVFAASEFLMSAGMGAITFLLFMYGLPHTTALSAVPLASLPFLLAPYGAILFALDGRPAIPTLMGYFRHNGAPGTHARPAIIIGTLFPAAVYTLFIYGVLALVSSPSKDAVTSLAALLPAWLLILVGALGFLAVFSTYIAIGRDIKKSLLYDFKFPNMLAGFTVVAAPLAIYLLGFREFLSLVNVVGGIFIGLEGILIALMWRRASQLPHPAPLISSRHRVAFILLLLVFTAGIIYEILYKVV